MSDQDQTQIIQSELISKIKELKDQNVNQMNKQYQAASDETRKSNELEELFLKCVDQVRKDIQRRKAVTLARNSNLNSSLHK